MKFPSMRDAVMAWAENTTVFITAKRQEDFKTVEQYFRKTVKMVRVPTGQQLEMKAEGQRKWNTETLYALPDLELKVDDTLCFDYEGNCKYRVLNKTDWSRYGYNEYQITSDYN